MSKAVLRALSDAQELENVIPEEGYNQLFVETLGTCNQERFVCTRPDEQKIQLVIRMWIDKVHGE